MVNTPTKAKEILWQPNPGPQTFALQRMEDEILFTGGRGSGKSLQQNTEILLPNGLYKQIKDVKEGEQIVSVDGTPTTVLGIFPQPEKQLYRITFEDGAFVDTDLDHRWSVWNDKDGYRYGWRVKTTQELINLKGRYAIPLMEKGVDGKTAPLYDPYVLGLVIGDGCTTGTHPIIYTPEPEIKKYLEDLGWSSFLRKDKVKPLYQMSLGKKVLKEKLYAEIGRFSKQAKHLPSQVFSYPLNDRISLLQGLLDTDGSCEKTGSVRFSTISPQLAKDVQKLVWSIGGKSRVRKSKPRISGFGTKENVMYMVSIGHLNKWDPFRLARKQERVKTKTVYKKRYIVDISPSVVDKSICLAVDHPSHLFVIKDYIVTHNTDAGIMFMIPKKYIDHPKYRGLVIRRNAEDLSDWIDRADAIYSQLGATSKGNPKNFTFPSGARILTGHLNDENAFDKYKGHEYHLMAIEELTQIASESSYVKLLGSNRSTIPELKPQVFCTSNPDGAGHMWVKKRFIQGKDANKTFYTKDGRTRIYVFATAEDNPAIMQDKSYMNYLESIKDSDPELYKQWRHGSWESFQLKGSVYGDLIDEAYEQKRITTFPIDPHTPVHGLWDLGWDDSTAIWLFQKNQGYVYFVGYYENSQQKLAHYYEELNRLAQERGFTLGNQYVPHDARQTELITGISKLVHLQQLFGTNRVHLNFDGTKTPSKHEGIQGTKKIIATSYFHTEYCGFGLERLKMYRRKFNPSLNKFSEDPIHDEFSHGADALRTGASVIYGPKMFSLEENKPRYTMDELSTLSQMKFYKENPKELKKMIREYTRKL